MRLLIIFFSFLISFTAFAQTEDTELVAGPKITFSESTFEFGEISQGDRVEHIFEYTNTGTSPLVLASVRTTCGCTATDWEKEPIAPGEKSSIKVKFNSTGKIGMQNKVVTIMSNAVNNPERVKIVTNVLRPEPVSTGDGEG
ncbi:MAG: hypothetical protein ACI9A7_000389 [Cyclobacteriaceae bacterium]|jgi:hypothetical protein